VALEPELPNNRFVSDDGTGNVGRPIAAAWRLRLWISLYVDCRFKRDCVLEAAKFIAVAK
jgi:hypothetical protein